MCSDVTPYSLHDDLTLTFLPSNLSHVVSRISYIIHGCQLSQGQAIRRFRAKAKELNRADSAPTPNQMTADGGIYKYNIS